jgi:hypothetical protein
MDAEISTKRKLQISAADAKTIATLTRDADPNMEEGAILQQALSEKFQSASQGQSANDLVVVEFDLTKQNDIAGAMLCPMILQIVASQLLSLSEQIESLRSHNEDLVLAKAAKATCDCSAVDIQLVIFYLGGNDPTINLPGDKITRDQAIVSLSKAIKGKLGHENVELEFDLLKEQELTYLELLGYGFRLVSGCLVRIADETRGIMQGVMIVPTQ